MHPQGRARWCCIACKRPQPLRPTLGWPRPWRSLLRCRCPRAQGCLRWPSSRLTTDVCSAPPAVAAARHCEPGVWTGARLETGAEAGEEACNLGCGTGWMSHRRGPHGPLSGVSSVELIAAPARCLSPPGRTCIAQQQHVLSQRGTADQDLPRKASRSNREHRLGTCTAGCGTAWLAQAEHQPPCSQALTLAAHD